MLARILFRLVLSAPLIALVACNGSNGSSGSNPPVAQASKINVRFVDGAPELDGQINGGPGQICGDQSLSCYLQVNGNTISSQLYYGYVTPFTSVRAGTVSLVAADSIGYTVGPIKTDPLAAGKSYTIVIAGNYPNYKALAFEEPAATSDVQVSLYEASPATPQTAFGSFRVSTKSNFKQLGTASLGQIKTVSVGKSVTDFGAYAGAVNNRIGTVTPVQINEFDPKNNLPFHAANRLSLFLFDASSGSRQASEVFGSLDQ